MLFLGQNGLPTSRFFPPHCHTSHAQRVLKRVLEKDGLPASSHPLNRFRLVFPRSDQLRPTEPAASKVQSRSWLHLIRTLTHHVDLLRSKSFLVSRIKPRKAGPCLVQQLPHDATVALRWGWSFIPRCFEPASFFHLRLLHDQYELIPAEIPRP